MRSMSIVLLVLILLGVGTLVYGIMLKYGDTIPVVTVPLPNLVVVYEDVIPPPKAINDEQPEPMDHTRDDATENISFFGLGVPRD